MSSEEEDRVVWQHRHFKFNIQPSDDHMASSW